MQGTYHLKGGAYHLYLGGGHYTYQVVGVGPGPGATNHGASVFRAVIDIPHKIIIIFGVENATSIIFFSSKCRLLKITEFFLKSRNFYEKGEKWAKKALFRLKIAKNRANWAYFTQNSR